MRTLIVIPARLESTRLPRKLLLADTGKHLIQHVWEAASCAASKLLVVATDSDLIAAVAHDFGAEVRITREHPNGTSRAAEAAADYRASFEAVCVLQADEPEIDPRMIDEVVQALNDHPEWDCVTAARKSSNIADFRSTNCVKVSALKDGTAIDFTREYPRRVPHQPEDAVDSVESLHIGIYAYRRDAIVRYAAAGPCERENEESLEQLRALHIGLKMGVVQTDHQSRGVDTRADYDAFVSRWRATHPAVSPGQANRN